MILKIVRGSLRHYSPEAMESKLNYSSKSDVYSFGNLIYEIISKTQTFGNYTVKDTINLVNYFISRIF